MAETASPLTVPKFTALKGTGKKITMLTAYDYTLAKLLDETGIELERRQLEVETIKTLGQHTVTASLHSDVSFPIRLDVVAAD